MYMDNRLDICLCVYTAIKYLLNIKASSWMSRPRDSSLAHCGIVILAN